MTQTEQVTFAADAVQSARVRQALIKASIAVASEDAETPGHAVRRAFAHFVLDSPAVAGAAAAMAVATSPALGTEPTDADLEFTVNSMFNALAGV